jgi:hypothetical protein
VLAVSNFLPHFSWSVLRFSGGAKLRSRAGGLSAFGDVVRAGRPVDRRH